MAMLTDSVTIGRDSSTFLRAEPRYFRWPASRKEKTSGDSRRAVNDCRAIYPCAFAQAPIAFARRRAYHLDGNAAHRVEEMPAALEYAFAVA